MWVLKSRKKYTKQIADLISAGIMVSNIYESSDSEEKLEELKKAHADYSTKIAEVIDQHLGEYCRDNPLVTKEFFEAVSHARLFNSELASICFYLNAELMEKFDALQDKPAAVEVILEILRDRTKAIKEGNYGY